MGISKLCEEEEVQKTQTQMPEENEKLAEIRDQRIHITELLSE